MELLRVAECVDAMESSQGRRVLLVIDSSTRRVVSTRPLKPVSLDVDAMLTEYMAYQQLLVRMQRRHYSLASHTRHLTWPQVTSARDPSTSEPFLLRTHGESNEEGGVHACVDRIATPACGAPLCAVRAGRPVHVRRTF